MTKAPLLLLLALPAAADPAAMRATLEAMNAQAAKDPAALGTREDASAGAGKSFDQSFTITTLAPVEYVEIGAPRKAPPQLEEQAPPRPRETVPPGKVEAPAPAPRPASDGSGVDYYFEGKQPVNGITIYTPKKGDGSTTGGAAPTEKYGTYGKYAIGAGALVVVGAVLAGGPIGIGLAVGDDAIIGAGAVLSFLFGKKK